MLVYDRSTMGRTSAARERLVDSARQLIHSSNYGSASVEDVCAAAGVNKGSFYYFFPSKRDLALAAIDAQWEGAKARILEPSFAEDIPPLDRISGFFRRAAQAQRRPVVLGCPFGNLAVEMGTLDEVIRDRVRAVLEGYRSYFEQAIRQAIAAGDIPAQDASGAAESLVAYFQGALLLAKANNDATVIERLGPLALHLIGAAHG